MTGRDFLPLGESLAHEASEAAWRTSVGRAYYAAFHVARELFEDLGFAVPKADRAHGYLWLRLCNCGEPTVEKVGWDLKDLRGERNFADYDLKRILPAIHAQDAVIDAKQIIQALDDAAREPIRTQITDAMK